LSSSQHHYEEHHGAEVQHQVGSPATLRQARAGADPMRPSYAFSGGCLAFTEDLRRVTWPRKFRPGITFKYDRITDPLEFLQVYTTTLEIAEGGNPHELANWSPLALKAPTLVAPPPSGFRTLVGRPV
jgi:hypothetical protein